MIVRHQPFHDDWLTYHGVDALVESSHPLTDTLRYNLTFRTATGARPRRQTCISAHHRRLVEERFDTPPVLPGKEVKQDVRFDRTLPDMHHREPRSG